MIVAVAGRRTDAPDSPSPRFPLGHIDAVSRQIRSRFEAFQASTIVSSAAAGADLLALQQAGALGLRRRVVLAGPSDRFKQDSVLDRPGDWGPLFDQIVGEVRAAGDLIELDVEGNWTGYLRVTAAILDEAVKLAKPSEKRLGALLVWDGKSRGDDDVTDAFRRQAAAAQFELLPPVLTLSRPIRET